MGADMKCNMLANAAGITGSFKAWLSDDVTFPADRFDVGYMGPYRILNTPQFDVVAVGWSGLKSGNLQNPINVDETGMPVVGSSVWTNTAADGTNFSFHCSKWTNSFPDEGARVGLSNSTDTTWTDQLNMVCSQMFRLYCFEDP